MMHHIQEGGEEPSGETCRFDYCLVKKQDMISVYNINQETFWNEKQREATDTPVY